MRTNTLTHTQATEAVKEALLSGYRTLARMKDANALVDKPKGDITTKGDVKIGTAIKESLQTSLGDFISFSEEHGREQVGSEPSYSVVFDDIDGTLNFKTGRGMLPHGSILGVFTTTDPRFNDCIAAGFLEFNSGNLYFAVKGQGAHVVEGFAHGKAKVQKVSTSGRKAQKEETMLRVSLDLYALGSLAPHLASYASTAWIGDFRSTAASLALVADGSIDIYFTANRFANPSKRKTGEELGPGYLLIREAGGTIIDWNGRDLGPQKIGMGEGKTYEVVAAATPELAKEALRSLRLQRL